MGKNAATDGNFEPPTPDTDEGTGGASARDALKF